VHKGTLTVRWVPIACISLHAPARRIERGAERGHAAPVRDLAVLVESDAGAKCQGWRAMQAAAMAKIKVRQRLC
jgi:hypothetical protein